MSNNTELHVDDLIKAGIFNIEDLEINRSGHLSDRQKRRLYFGLASWLASATLEVGILILFLVIGDFYVAYCGFLLVILPVYLSLMEARPFWLDIKDDISKTLTGKLYKDYRVASSGKSARIAFCSIRVRDQVFPISPVIYDHIIHESVYRVYYVTNTRSIINIEPL